MAVSARQSILRSVFPSAPLTASVPTPEATPLLLQESFDDSQPAPGILDAEAGQDSALEKIRWERAWSLATSFFLEHLNPGAHFVPEDCPHNVREAIHYVRSPDSTGYRLRQTSQADDLVWWYSQVVQLVFLKQRVPGLKHLLVSVTSSAVKWNKFLSALIDCRTSLLGPYRRFLAPTCGLHSSTKNAVIENDFRALVAESLAETLEPKLLSLIIRLASIALSIQTGEYGLGEGSMEGIENSQGSEAAEQLLHTLSRVVLGGFSGAWVERLLAAGFDKVIRRFVITTFAKRWESPSPCVDELKHWVSESLAQLCGRALFAITRDPQGSLRPALEVSSTHIRDWQRRAVNELGRLRLSELFDIVVDWDNGSKGGIEDLRQYLTGPARRKYVIDTFNEVLSYRLLIPGASTTEILQMYIRIIRAFALLDSRFVILDRVGRPIRRYLRDRDDTVKIIVGGLLADPEDPDAPTDALVELATELHQMDEIAANDEDIELDWDDMTWMPNPADAEPDFKRTKNLDVIGNLISLFDNKEIFVREFQNILGERLLGANIDFDREIRVLELLKSRFGDAALQGCEVMLKDIFDSRRTDVLIKKEQNIAPDSAHPQIYAKILSRFFWPSLRGEDFHIPPPVQGLFEKYAQGFMEHKMQRKLAWLPALGQVTVELQLKYRTVKELVTTWQASVIYAFSSDDNNNDDDSAPAPSKTAEELVEELQMDEDLVTNALTFWVSKLVLYSPQPNTYSVLEVLPTESAISSAAGEQQASADIVAAAQSASAAAAASAASAVRSEEELAEEKMEVVWQYVVGMLTNQGSMPLQQMVMMLNFVVPGGFTHSNEDFRAFLQRRVDDGRLEMAGANYRVPKNAPA